MGKYVQYQVDTHLPVAFNQMEGDRIKHLAISMAKLLVEVHRLEFNRVRRYKNLKQRGIRSKAMVLIEKKLKEILP